MYIYNYSFPEGLDTGDLLWTLSGSVQEFTGDHAAHLPRLDHPREGAQLPAAEWDKYLKQCRSPEINLRLCGLDNVPNPYITDSLCGHNSGNMKMESLESALVSCAACASRRSSRTATSTATARCPSSAERPTSGDLDPRTARSSDAPGRSGRDRAPVQHRLRRSAWASSPGRSAPSAPRTAASASSWWRCPARARVAGLDDSLDKRTQIVTVERHHLRAHGDGHQRGHQRSVPGARVVRHPGAHEVRPAGGGRHHRRHPAGRQRPASIARWSGTSSTWPSSRTAIVAGQGASAAWRSTPQPRINVVTRDAIPDLQLDCNPTDSDADKAEQCRLLHAATFDVTGHLRQVQPARPRWIVLPRDVDDVCCSPGPGAQCPRPIKQCPAETP